MYLAYGIHGGFRHNSLDGKDRTPKHKLTGRIFCTAVVIRAGFTLEVDTFASLMATTRTLSAGMTLSILKRIEGEYSI